VSACKGALDLFAILQIRCAMADLLSPQDIERLAATAGMSIADVCRRAGVAPSIFSRWKAGKTEPNLENYRRIRDAAYEAVKQRADTSAASVTKPKRSRTPPTPDAEPARPKSAVAA
jgi:transcriptional regulator with XRE-family HTH domain